MARIANFTRQSKFHLFLNKNNTIAKKKPSIRPQFTIHEHAINLFDSNGAHSNYTLTNRCCCCYFCFFLFNVSVCGENEKFLVSACGVVLVVQGKHRSINSNQLKIVSNTPI